MAETIESFVAKLKTQGVEQGRQQADQILAEAQAQAEKIVSAAKAEAEQVLAAAEKQGQELLARSQTELGLAARDASIKLRETLVKSLQSVIAGPVGESLNDAEFLRSVMTDIMNRYVAADIEGTGVIKLNLNDKKYHELAEWAIKQIRSSAKHDGIGIDLKGTLRQAGFEYNITGATVEMTQESIVEIMMGLVGPKLREVFSSAK